MGRVTEESGPSPTRKPGVSLAGEVIVSESECRYQLLVDGSTGEDKLLAGWCASEWLSIDESEVFFVLWN